MSHAVIMGGSIAGLCAAAALAKNFDRVTVLERDPEPGCLPHRGAPQAYHLHAILNRGQQIIEQLLPGTLDAMRSTGALSVDLGTGLRWFHFGSWKPRSHTGMDMLLQTRPLFEHHVRQSVRRLRNVELRFDAAIDEPVHENGRVVGIRMRDGDMITADLVIDATGRGSHSPTWLEQWGYGRVKEQRVDIGLGYVSGIFKLPPGRQPKEALAIYQHAPINRRGALVFPIEGERVMMTFIGYHGDHAPTDLPGLRKWARGLLRPEAAEFLDQATLLGELRRFNFPTQIRRCFGAMTRLPDGYIVMGDAMCAFDPTFAQGMSVAAMQAEILTQLRPGMSAARWQRKLSRMTLTPFSMTANEAHRWPETRGWAPPLARFQRWYVAHVFRTSSTDEVVYRRLFQVMHFLVPPTGLFAPKIMARLWAAHRESKRALALPPRRSTSVELDLSLSHQTGY